MWVAGAGFGGVYAEQRRALLQCSLISFSLRQTGYVQCGLISFHCTREDMYDLGFRSISIAPDLTGTMQESQLLKAVAEPIRPYLLSRCPMYLPGCPRHNSYHPEVS
jgi:hypothetical protein